MKSILCYGDSNTWGFVPGTFGIRERYDRNTRWTGRLQLLLDPKKYYVIEEGLSGRTTNLNYQTKPPGYRGTEFFEPILYTHSPLDLVIIMLGINDLKKEFQSRTSKDITQGIKELIEIVRSTNYGPNMKVPAPVLIVSTPTPVDTDCRDVNEMFENAKDRTKDLANDLKNLVGQYDKDVYFLDAAPHVQLSPVDGIHFDEKAHENFALLIHQTIKKILE